MSKFFKSQNPTVEQYRNSRGTDVPIDTFLYACLEAEQTKKALGSQQGKNIQWPTLSDFSPEDLKEELDAQALLDVFEDLLSWYAANYPDLSTNLAWDYGTVSLVVQPLVSMAADVGNVYEKKSGSPLPEYVENLEETDPVWSLVKGLVDRFFASKSFYIMRYMMWSFSKEKSIQAEPGSRPPVGRFSPGAQNRARQSGPPPNRNQDHQDRRPPRDGGGGSGRNDHRRDRNEFGGRGNSGGNHNPNHNRGNQQREGGPRGNDRHRHNGPKRHDVNPEMEAAAIQACNEAMAFLESNPGEEKVILKPQNSFYRRIQHQVVVSNGYHSESIGEDQERAVAVWRRGGGT